MATKQPQMTAFMAKLLAPLPALEQAALVKADRAERKEDWHANWLLARRDLLIYEAADLDRAHNVFYGDKTQRDTSAAKFKAYESVERLILTPGTASEDIKTKRNFARKVLGGESCWPEEWIAALSDDEEYVAARKRERLARSSPGANKHDDARFVGEA